MIYSNSTDCFRNQSTEKPCENCTVLKNQVKYLIKTCARFTRGKANLEVLLGSQLCVWQSWTWLQSIFSKENQEVI